MEQNDHHVNEHERGENGSEGGECENSSERERRE